MQIALLTNPASGQANVQLTTAQELIRLGHGVTFITGESFRKKVDRFRRKQSDEKMGQLITFMSLGSERGVEDFTPRMQESIHKKVLRKAPGDIKSMQTCMEVAFTNPEEHVDSALRLKEALDQLDPDLVVVDILSPVLVTGARISGRKWLLTVPCSPGLTGLPTYFDPHPMAADRSGSWRTFCENIYLGARDLSFGIFSERASATRVVVGKRLNLPSFGIRQDTRMVPPIWDEENCLGGIHYNVFGLTDCPKQPSNFVFVGAGISEEPRKTAAECSIIAWMDDALAWEEDVVYINMGSMFIWEEQEFWGCIEALKHVYKMRDGKVRFIFKMNNPVDSDWSFSMGKLPSYIRLTHWIDSQQSVYEHPALAIFVHHGGGNSFNEAVAWGLPQFILSQWLDTHEMGLLAERFGFGLRSARPPKIEQQDVQEKLLLMLGPARISMKAKATTWALRSKLGGGAAAAAKIIECHAETYSPHRQAFFKIKTEQ